MVFSIVVILLIAVIAYFHYVQGLLSGVLSAVCAIIAALLAFSYHEQVIGYLQGKIPDTATSLILVAMFLVIYLILRTIFDNVVPGNVRFPAIVDKVGGALTGAIAALFAVGIFAIATQALPFGASIAGYSRYTLEDREIRIPGKGGVMQDTKLFEELKADKLDPDDHQAMFVPADDMVVNFINKLSDGGSLAGDRTVASVHPAFVDQLFFQRWGIQTGGKHVAVNTDKRQQFTVQKLMYTEELSQAEAEIPEVRSPRKSIAGALQGKAPLAIIIVSAQFDDNATDSDHLVRLAPTAVRLVGGATNYYAIGTLENGGLYNNKPDDYMLLHPGQTVDFVFVVERDKVLDKAPAAAAAGGDATLTVKNGVFIEAKRNARVGLGGMSVAKGVEVQPSGVMRKPTLAGLSGSAGASAPRASSASGGAARAGGAAPRAGGAAAPAAGQVPFKAVGAQGAAKLFTEINVGKHEADSSDLKFNSGSASLKEGKLTKFELHPKDSMEDVAKGDGKVSELYAPAGTHVVMVSLNIPGSGDPTWKWASDLADIKVVDDKGIDYSPNGALATLSRDDKEYLLGKFDADEPVTKIDKEESGGTPSRVTIIYLIPDNTTLKSLSYKGQKVTDIAVQ